jgi:tRNA modification GTPase
MTGNRAFPLTPPGVAAIAVVRIVGAGVGPFLQQHFSKPARPMRCVHGELRDGERVLDDAVVILHRNGLAADLNLHGGPWVVTSVLEWLKANGFELADAATDLLDGETILEREVHASLPLAKTEQGIRMLLAQPTAWERFAASNPTADAIRAVLDDRTLERLLCPARVAIVGAPNVGKSTLANQLFAQQRSITADVPGTTRDWVGEIANIDGLPVMLVDTPGRRKTEDVIERAAIERSNTVIHQADVVIHVVDATSSFPSPGTPGEGRVRVEALCADKVEPSPRLSRGTGRGAGAQEIVVMNKIDQGMHGVARFDVGTIATTGEGVDQLRDLIRARLSCADLTPDYPRCWTDRQRAALQHHPRDVLVSHE